MTSVMREAAPHLDVAHNRLPVSSPRLVGPNDLLRLRFVRDGRLSPDGNLAAYAISRTVESEQAEYCGLWIRDLCSENLRAVATGEVFAIAPRWSPGGRRLAFLQRGVAGHRIRMFSLETGTTSEITPNDIHIQGAPTWSPDGAHLAACVFIQPRCSGNRRVTRRIGQLEGLGAIEGAGSFIRVFHLENGTWTDFETPDEVCASPKWAPRGAEILVLATATGELGRGRFPRLCTINAQTGRFREVLDKSWEVEAAEWCPDGVRIVVAGARSRVERVPAAALWVINPDGSYQRRTEASIPHVGFRFHHDMPMWDSTPTFAVPSDGFALITAQAGGHSSLYRVALLGALRCEEVIGGDRSCVILDACYSERRLLFWVTTFDTPSELCVAQWSGDASERRITDLNSAVMALWPPMRVKPLQMTSSDGLRFQGWYMSRQDTSGPQPTVLFIHGGPYMAAGCVFRFDFWLLAANGYAVLFANFRGSLGYGSDFSVAIDPDWGSRGFPDHMAAVDAAVAQGFADGARLGVWGASHGGLATTWIVGHTNRFRAAVAEAAITDFYSLYYLSDLPDFFAELLGGTPNEVPQAYRAHSPLTYASRCKTPTLLIHGEQDARCPMAAAESFLRALMDTGCTAELVKLKDCTHMGDSVGPLSARVGQNEALLDWFERYL